MGGAVVGAVDGVDPPPQRSASSATCAGSAESLVCISAVTTNSPASSSRWRWLDGSLSVMGDPESSPRFQVSGSLPGPTARHCRSRPVTRFSHDDVPCSRQSTGGSTCRMWSRHRGPPRALPRGDPDAFHLGHDLTVPVLQRATARAVAQVLRATHRATARSMQDALPAHAAVPPLPSSRVRRAGAPGGTRSTEVRLRRPSIEPGSLHRRSSFRMVPAALRLAQGGGGDLLPRVDERDRGGRDRERSVLGLHVDGRPGAASSIGTQAYPMFFSSRGDQTASVTLPTSRPSRTTGQNHDSSAFSSSPDHSTPTSLRSTPFALRASRGALPM